jgi:hypothetical protein
MGTTQQEIKIDRWPHISNKKENMAAAPQQSQEQRKHTFRLCLQPN